MLCKQRQDKLTELASIEGASTPDDLIEAAILDSVVPGICMEEGCSYSTEVEPDQTQGWCEECDKGTVESCLSIAGII